MLMTPPKNPRIGVAGILQRPDRRLLLGQRNSEPSRGLWAFPGGSLKWGERLGDAVIREFYEETGLMVQPVAVAYIAEVIRDPYHFVIVDYLVKASNWDVRPLTDLDALAWVDADEIRQLALAEGMQACIADREWRRLVGWDA